MRSIADLTHDVRAMSVRAAELRACVDALRVAVALDPGPAARAQVADAADLAQAQFCSVERRLQAFQSSLKAARTAAACCAHAIAAMARGGQRIDHIEHKLLEVLGGAPPERGDLTEAEHLYVVAALDAREATGQEERALAFAVFVAARAALLAEPRRAA